jgi:hypothetical protein
MSEMISRRRLLIGSLAATVPATLYFWLGNYPDPRFQLSRLKGLTPAEVVSLCGDPDVDLRSARFGSWTPEQEATAGPLTFEYEDRWRWRGFGYLVVFHNGKVDQIRIGQK